MGQTMVQRIRHLLTQWKLISLCSVVLLVAIGLLVISERYSSYHDILQKIASWLVSLVVLPIVLKLWFWSGVHETILSALGEHKTLRRLGLVEVFNSTIDWTKVVGTSDKELIIISAAAQPLRRPELQKIMRSIAEHSSKITVCYQHPSVRGRFDNENLLDGSVESARKFLEELKKGGHRRCTIQHGYVRIELKYTLILGSEKGVYIPHPADQTQNKSATMLRCVFNRQGELHRFLEPDIKYVLEKLEDVKSEVPSRDDKSSG